LNTGVPYPSAGLLGRTDTEGLDTHPVALAALGWSHQLLTHWRQSAAAGPAPYLLGAAELTIAAREANLVVNDRKVMIWRSGPFITQGIYIRSANRNSATPGNHNIFSGLRVARTIRPSRP
jgi:hypothetical protein